MQDEQRSALREIFHTLKGNFNCCFHVWAEAAYLYSCTPSCQVKEQRPEFGFLLFLFSS